MAATTTGASGGRPVVMSRNGVVSSGHYLATEIGIDVLRRGGNAMDAAAAVGFALTVLQPHQNGIGGEAPLLIYSARQRKVWAVSGHGVAPKAATLRRFQAAGLDLIPPDGFLPALVPPAFATWLLVLRRFGTRRLSEVLPPAVALARDGFGMYDSLHNSIRGMRERFVSEWPSSADAFLRRGEAVPPGEPFRQPQWAATFAGILSAERRYRRRADGLRAAHDAFYRGPVAARIVEFVRSTPIRDASGEAHAGLLSEEDFAAYEATVEEPVAVEYRGVKVYKCGPWTQGPVLLQALNLLEGYDLAAMGHNSAPYIHVVVECMKLAYADREFYYGDPRFVRVPLRRLLSKGYAAARRDLVTAAASMELRPGGRPPIQAESLLAVNARVRRPTTEPAGGDTTKLEVIDRFGNMVSATPSGGWLMSSPVIPGLGFPLGTRGQMFSLAAGHPNRLQPGKRPRTSLTPSLATRGDRPFLVFGSPGGDCQDQWALQFFLNVVEFGMSLQEAVEAPTFWAAHFPSSFYPRRAEPGSLFLEGRIRRRVCTDLAARGHVVHRRGAWAGGNTLAAAIDAAGDLRCAAASPRYEPAYAAAY